MRRLFLFVTVAAPAVLTGHALADTTITNDRNTPIATATISNGGPDNIIIDDDGSIEPTSPGAAVTINSNNTVSNDGAIGFEDVNDATGVLINGGNTGSFENTGTIAVVEDVDIEDDDDDGDNDGRRAQGSNRFGVRVTGSSPFIGDITQNEDGSISVEGNNSAGILVESGGLTGNISIEGSVGIAGDNSYGVRTQGAVSGNVYLNTSVSASGENSTAVSIESSVGGRLQMAGSMTSTGYRFTSRPNDDEDIAELDADDLYQSNSSVRITGSVAGGVIFDARPTDEDDDIDDEDGDGIDDDDDEDLDNDGIEDEDEGTSSIVTYGGAPAVQIGSASGAAITFGEVGTLGINTYNYGLVNKGTIFGSGVYDDVDGVGMRIENTTITGGFYNEGTIQSSAYKSQSTAIALGAGANISRIDNDGTILGRAISESSGDTAIAIDLEAGANVGEINNTETIAATVDGERANAVVIRDNSDSLRLITNAGQIYAQHNPNDDDDDDASLVDNDDANFDEDDEEITGSEIAIDLSSQTIGSTVRQTAAAADETDSAIQGDILFGSGGDTLQAYAGTITGDISFGAGADTLEIAGGALVESLLSDSDNNLALVLGTGELDLLNLSALSVSSLTMTSGSILTLHIDPANAANGSGRIDASGAATFSSGSQLSIRLETAIATSQTFRVVNAASVSGGGDVSLVNGPFLYNAVAVSSANTLDVTLTRKTAAELGMNRNQGAAYESVFAAISADTALDTPFLSLSSRDAFYNAYDQFLPNATGAEVDLAEARAQSVSQFIFERFTDVDRKRRGVYTWGQEFGYRIDRERTGEGQGFDAFALGFALGMDAPVGDKGVGGVGISWTSGDIEEKTGTDDPSVMNTLEAFTHVAYPMGPLLVGGRVGVAYDRYSHTRRIEFTSDTTDEEVSRAADAEWNGAHASAALRAALPTKLGPFALRPEAGVDVLALWQDGYEESGGGTGVDLAVESRNAVRASTSALVAIGVPFKTAESIVTPEIRIGARYRLIDEAFETEARFLSGGESFLLESDLLEDKLAGTIGLSLTAAGELGTLRLEANAEGQDGDVRTSARAVLRLTF